MILFPAIDLKQGQCVRLWKGRMDRATIFNDSPADQARTFVEQGCEWLHLVDLDGAFAGHPVNGAAVDAILETVSVPVQLGGGIRDLSVVAMWLSAGVTRVILGTAAVKDPEFVRAAANAYPGKIVVGIDADKGRVAVEGWADVSKMTAADLAKRYEDCGVGAIVYTDIERDGTLSGLNVDATAELARQLSIPVIASGGVSSMDDLVALKKVADAGIEGVIVGRALYDGKIDLAEALKLLRD